MTEVLITTNEETEEPVIEETEPEPEPETDPEEDDSCNQYETLIEEMRRFYDRQLEQITQIVNLQSLIQENRSAILEVKQLYLQAKVDLLTQTPLENPFDPSESTPKENLLATVPVEDLEVEQVENPAPRKRRTL